MAQVDSPDDIGAAGKHLVRRLIDEGWTRSDSMFSTSSTRRRAWLPPVAGSNHSVSPSQTRTWKSSHSWPKATWLRRGSGVPRHTWGRGAPTGRRFRNVDEAYFFTIRDGRIVSAWGLEDNDRRRWQLGM